MAGPSRTEEPSDDPRIVLGVVTRPHGVQGAVRVKVFNPDTEVLAPGARVMLGFPGAEPTPVEVLDVREGAETWIVVLDGSETREDAEALRGAELSVKRSELPPLEPGEFYHADLPGFDVRDANGGAFGTVKEVVRYPSVDALVVVTPRGLVEVPLVEGIVASVDVPSRVVVVDVAALGEE